MSGATSAHPEMGVRAGRVRPALLIIAVFALAGTIVATVFSGTSGWWVALGLVAPDLVPLVRFSRPIEPGRMPASMVGLYNATHALPGPFVLAGMGVVLAQPAAIIVAAAWVTHIVGDRSMGYTLRSRDGSIRSAREGAAAPRHAGARMPRR